MRSGNEPNRPLEVEANSRHRITKGIESPYRYHTVRNDTVRNHDPAE